MSAPLLSHEAVTASRFYCRPSLSACKPLAQMRSCCKWERRRAPLAERARGRHRSGIALAQAELKEKVVTSTSEEDSGRESASATEITTLVSTQEESAPGESVNEEDESIISDTAATAGSAVLGVAVLGLALGLGALGFVFKDQLNAAIDYFSAYIEDAGPLGYVAFTLGYAGLEILAIPALPLTMSAGLLFGSTVGTILCSLSGTLAATVAFLIARYVARDRILGLVKGNKKYLAIDKAVGEDSFRVVTLLRLSPLLPFSLGNYVYGLTSVRLVPYVLGSWIGMLPGTWAYVSAGAFGRSLLEAEEGGFSVGNSSLWSLAAALGVTVLAATYVTNLAKNAVKNID